MSETKETKTGRKRVVIALGIICVVLAVGLVGALAYSESIINANSSQGQATSLGWTEGILAFSLKPTDDTSYTISTGGFRTVTITIESYNGNENDAFQVFIGFISANTTLSWQVYDAESWGLHTWAVPVNGPPWYVETVYPLNSFRQTYDVTFSQVQVWIWNNSTVRILGNIYYYLTA